MIHVKKTTIWDRIRGAIKGFKCTPFDALHLGMEIHRCDQCEHKHPNPPETMVFYICDRKACDSCDNPMCKHTNKVEHAKNFKSNAELGKRNGYSDYWEVEQSAPNIPDGSSYFLTPENEEVTLADCPVGLFVCDDILGMKTEYMTQVGENRYIFDVYIVETGERFCIPNNAMVKPCGVYTAD